VGQRSDRQGEHYHVSDLYDHAAGSRETHLLCVNKINDANVFVIHFRQALFSRKEASFPLATETPIRIQQTNLCGGQPQTANCESL
jgi:hypothetical protein